MKTRGSILITGATSGIGRHAALHLAKLGFRVIATGRKLDLLAELKTEAGAERFETLELDVAEAASIARATERVDELTEGHGVDVLVNNAGYGLAGAIVELTDDDVRAQFETNVFGLLAMIRAFVPKMIARRSGRVINVGSSGGKVSIPLAGAYHATKFAVEALSDALRMELRPFNIQVSVIEPGPIKTNFGATALSTIEKYRNASSPYARVYAKADAIKAQADVRGADPDCVTRAIEHAIVSRRPRLRYAMPFPIRLGLALYPFVPARLVDWAMCQAIGLTTRNFASVPALRAPRE